MSNIICSDNSSANENIKMKNSLTDVFINVLALSGSYLAETVDEKRLIVWISEKDQTLGRGCVSFNICDMPWNKNNFYDNKKFILKVIIFAKNKLEWEKLNYTPYEEWLLPCLNKFQNLIEKLNITDIKEISLQEWIENSENNDPINCNFPRCKKHNTLLTFLGCQVCNS